MLKAFMDQVDGLVVHLSRRHYQGISNHFRIRGVGPATIKEHYSDDDGVVYHLAIPSLEIGREYYLVEEHGLTTLIHYRYVVTTTAFDELFPVKGVYGPRCYKDHSEFRLYAPTASQVLLRLLDEDRYVPLVRDQYGSFHLRLEGDFHLARYRYLVKVNGQINEVVDPYAVASLVNAGASVLVEQSLLSSPFLDRDLPPLHRTIYEISLADVALDQHKVFTSLALAVDYIASLGISDVQILPLADFGSLDEEEVGEAYNWGYDPVQYFVPEGTYASSPDPLVRIEECQGAIRQFHEAGIGVIADVVYNHVYDPDSFALEKIIPYYCFRRGPHGRLSNGSFCHNDLETSRPFVRRLIIDSLVHWVRCYGVDGFRFDLMGIIDIETIRQAQEALKAINPHIILYGEGWVMPTDFDQSLLATMNNHRLLSDVGYFNDRFREVIKGSTWCDHPGFVLGNLEDLAEVATVLAGAVFDQPSRSLNYIEAHDNMTFFDKMVALATPNDQLLPRLRLGLALVTLAQGIPFFHGGQEFGRSKGGVENSYNSPLSVNRFDYQLPLSRREEVSYFRALLSFRRRFIRFFDTRLDYDFLTTGAGLVYQISGQGERLSIVINVATWSVEVDVKGEVVFGVDGLQAGLVDKLLSPPLSVIIIKSNI